MLLLIVRAFFLFLRGLDNAAYYALSEDNQTYWNNPGDKDNAGSDDGDSGRNQLEKELEMFYLTTS